MNGDITFTFTANTTPLVGALRRLARQAAAWDWEIRTRPVRPAAGWRHRNGRARR